MGILFFLIAIICLLLLSSIHSYGYYIQFVHIDGDIFSHIILYRGAWTAWSIGSALCYLSLVHRLHSVFAHSSYHLSSSLILTFYVLIVLFFSLESASTFCYILYFSENLDLAEYEMYHLVIVIFQEIVDFILTVFLIRIFIDKLTSVMLNLSDEYTSVLSPRHLQMIDVITKYNVLGIPAIVSTQLFLLIDMVFIIIILVTSDAGFEEVADTHFLPFVWILDCITNVLCLFLNASDTLYWYGVLCGKCHRYQKQRKMQSAQRQVSIGLTAMKTSLLSDSEREREKGLRTQSSL